MGKYDDQSEERSPSNATNQMGAGMSAGMAGTDGRGDDCFSQGATSSSSFVFLSSELVFCRQADCCTLLSVLTVNEQMGFWL